MAVHNLFTHTDFEQNWLARLGFEVFSLAGFEHFYSGIPSCGFWAAVES